jgi:hypothetical protein
MKWMARVLITHDLLRYGVFSFTWEEQAPEGAADVVVDHVIVDVKSHRNGLVPDGAVSLIIHGRGRPTEEPHRGTPR